MSTIREVAQKAGVSPTTVSHVVNKTRFVSEDVRQRVQAAMDELNYRPNALARSLRRGKTHTLGLILPDSANPFFAEVGRAVESTAFALGYSVILCNAEGDPNKEQLYVDVLSKRQVDGMILVSTGANAESLHVILNVEQPIVIIDRDLPGVEIDAVLADNCQGGYLATQHLIQQGHKRIGCISGPSFLTPSAQRVIGYRQALAEAGLPVDEELIVRGDFHSESGRVGALALLNRPDAPTAIFACNDMMAIGTLRAAVEASRRVPDDLAVVGFDDIELASFTIPPLTTMIQPKMDMGRQAVQLLTERMVDRSRPWQRLVLASTLIVRGSSVTTQL